MSITDMYPFLVNFTSSQATFVERLAEHLQQPVSDTVGSIVAAMSERLDEDEDEEEEFIEELQENRRTPGGYRQLTVTLPQEQMDYLTSMSRKSQSSHSAVVRHMVSMFMGQVEEEAGKPD